jgi:hypothetical protein
MSIFNHQIHDSSRGFIERLQRSRESENRRLLLPNCKNVAVLGFASSAYSPSQREIHQMVLRSIQPHALIHKNATIPLTAIQLAWGRALRATAKPFSIILH